PLPPAKHHTAALPAPSWWLARAFSKGLTPPRWKTPDRTKSCVSEAPRRRRTTSRSRKTPTRSWRSSRNSSRSSRTRSRS
ncbi:hypothetical protein DFJ74DRAFT_774791, partial [Hyaloraphidium curvatum]